MEIEMTAAIDHDLLNGLSIPKTAAKHCISERAVRNRREELGLTKGPMLQRTPAQIMADMEAQRIADQAAKDQLAALLATGGDTAALGDYRARYGPKARPWTMAQMRAMYCGARLQKRAQTLTAK